jgi:uncharacterized SAM-binding protein YcdF (DUF218 family)
MAEAPSGRAPRPPRRALRRALRATLALALAGALLFGGAALAIAVDGFHDEPGPTPCDVAVVLGARVYEDGTPSPQLEDRLGRALEVWLAGRARVLVVSGGRGAEGHDEAAVMARWLEARGVPSGRIVVDHEGWTTWDTARNVRDLLRARGLSSVLVVTSWFHTPRARLALERLGVRPVATARAHYRPALRDLYSLPREVAAWAWYLTRRDLDGRGR